MGFTNAWEHEFPCDMNVDCSDYYPEMGKCGWVLVDDEEGFEKVCMPEGACDTTIYKNGYAIQINCETDEYEPVMAGAIGKSVAYISAAAIIYAGLWENNDISYQS